MMKYGHFAFKNREALWIQKTKSSFYTHFIIILMVVSFKKPQNTMN